jgi:small GTP-binding protein
MKRVRCVLCGDSSVGKSSIIRRFSKGIFSDSISETIGGAFHSAQVLLHKETICIEVWDTAGSERYHSIILSFFKNASAVGVVYDLASRPTFSRVDFWIELARENAPPGVPLFLVGNKADLSETRMVSGEEGKLKSLEDKLAGFAETSAKTGEGIDTLFSMIAMVPGTPMESVDPASDVISLDKNQCC